MGEGKGHHITDGRQHHPDTRWQSTAGDTSPEKRHRAATGSIAKEGYMPVTFSVPITQWYVGETLPVPTIFYTDDSGAPITLTGATLALTIRNRASGVDTAGAGAFTIVGSLASLTGATISAGATVTALPCSAGTSVALPVGATIICSTAGNAETFTYSGTVPLPAGAVSIPVVSPVAPHTPTAGGTISRPRLAPP